MKFSIGDRVLLKRTGEEGFITEFLSRQMVEVEVGGTRFPVYADELEHPYLRWFTEPRKTRTRKIERDIPLEKPAERPIRLSRGIYLSFLPEFSENEKDDIIKSFRVHLLNETADHILFGYYARTVSGDTLLELKGTLHPFAGIFLHALLLEEMNKQPRFHWEVATRDKPTNNVRDVLRIRASQLIRHISTIMQEGQPSFTILLTQDAEGTETSINVPAILKAVVSDSLEHTLHTQVESILDLHANELGDLVDGLTPAEVLFTQCSLLHRKLDAAYAAGLDSMIIIHGIGGGSLREAVHNLLKDTAFIRSYSNHWMPGYGWGATEAVFDRG